MRPTTDIFVAIEMKVFRTWHQNQPILSALIIFVAVIFVLIIILRNVFRNWTCKRNAIRGLLGKDRGDDCSENNCERKYPWNLSGKNPRQHDIYQKYWPTSWWTLHFWYSDETNLSCLVTFAFRSTSESESYEDEKERDAICFEHIQRLFSLDWFWRVSWSFSLHNEITLSTD